ncbi:MAG: cell division protein FtsZ [Flammeovirgaceae bacterium]|nr:cell division protein FtsZ [Flammeovirgaceae bacterium]MDW8287348.1 cell division protein FtsZ [Flammeovirgaceae bacterium]
MDYEFDIPQETKKSIIKVIGVGGGGSNAVNHMYRQGIKSVDFYVCNTDKQALEASPVPNKIQLGAKGLGAGADPEKGRSAALESKPQIKQILEGAEMVFITAGMGGGTGTGAAPIIAQIAREMEILTVGIVTLPFAFEGTPKMKKAEAGIQELKQFCDALLIILNERIKEVYGEMNFKKAFAQADEVLSKAAQSISDLINKGAQINVDFEDVRTVMKNAGTAVMGTFTASGEKRARKAIEGAVTSPLLDNTNIKGAKYLLLSIKISDLEKLEMKEVEEITKFVQEQAGSQAEVIFGVEEDQALGDALSVTIIATGFQTNKQPPVLGKKELDLNFLKSKKQLEKPQERDFFDKPEEDNSREIIIDIKRNTPSIEHKPTTSKKVYSLDDDDAEKENSHSEDFKRKADGKKLFSSEKSINEMTEEEIKELQELPSYLRKGIKLG